MATANSADLFQVMPAYEDIFMSHSSWFDYQATMRIYKHYDLNVNDPDTAAQRLSFSSYPGECVMVWIPVKITGHMWFYHS